MAKTTAEQFLENKVQVAPGLGMAREVSIAATVNGYDVVVDVVPEGGRLVARNVRVSRREGGPPVTGEALRSIPVAELTKRAVEYVFSWDESNPGVVAISPILRITEADAERFREAGPTKWTLENVADVYRVALLLGEPPTRAVESTFGVPRSTAGRWVAAAREQGFLGQAEGPGKAGV